MIVARPTVGLVQTVMLPGTTPSDALDARCQELALEARATLVADGVEASEIQIEKQLDVRYRGQSYELTIPLEANYAATFHSAHEDSFGYSDTERRLEIVNLRISAWAHREVKTPGTPNLDALARWDAEVVLSSGEEQSVSIYDGDTLGLADAAKGPALLTYPDTTVLLEADDVAEVVGSGDLLITIRGA